MDETALLNLVGQYVKLDGILWRVESVLAGFEDIPPALVLFDPHSQQTIIAPLPKVEILPAG